ncbi:MAG: TonB-dependent receptor [Bryobacteraceae bacterium]|jgi:hypothetical protein
MRFYLPQRGLAARLLCMFLMTLVLAFAQNDRGTITGTITDPTGAIVPSAAIHARDTATGAEYDTISTATGNYALADLLAGIYDVTVTAAGFEKYIQHGITVQVVQVLRVDIVLKVGSTSESVTVNADAPLLRTENAELNHNLSTDRVDALPNTTTNMRDPFEFSGIMPGVVGGVTAPAGSANIKVNGGPATGYRVLLDGQDITNANEDPSHTLEQQPAVESLQEFTLQTSNFAAEFGQVANGLFNFTTKSGTNGLHGVAFTFVRNEDLNAGEAYTIRNGDQHLDPASKMKNYGGAIGGPVVIPKVYNGRNKTFFFADLELERNFTVGNGYVTMPTVGERGGDFSQALVQKVLGTNINGGSILENMIFDPLTDQTVNGQVTRTPFPNNVIPASRLNAVALTIQNTWLPTPTNGNLVNNWNQIAPSAEKRHIPSIKFDQNIGDKSKISIYGSNYLYYANARNDDLPAPISSERNRKIFADTYQLHYDYTPTPTWVLHFGFGFVRGDHDDNYLPASLAFVPASIGLNGSYTPGFPTINTLGNSTVGGFSTSYGMGVGAPVVNLADKPTVVLNATNVRGNHTYKIGIQWRLDTTINKNAIAAPTYGFSGNETALPYLNSATVGGNTIGLPYASYLLGLVDSATVPPTQDPDYRKHSMALYLQDTWKVTRKLTLDYGIRWDYQTAPEELYNRASMFGPTVVNENAGNLLGGTIFEGNGAGKCNCQFTTTYPFAIGPRLGIAYQFAPKMVLRAGWGLSYGPTPDGAGTGAVGEGWNTLSFSSTSFGETPYIFGQGLPYTAAQIFSTDYDPGIRPQTGQINNPPTYEDRNAGRPSRINQWNIAVQRELTPNIAAEVAYVGNHGVWLQSSSYWDLNALTPQRISQAGLNLNSTADLSLLNSPLNSSLAASRGFNVPPYPGFPLTLTVAQALRPYPQFGSIVEDWAPLGDTWYDALQAKITKRTSYGLAITAAYTRSKTLDVEAENYNGGGVINDEYNRNNLKALSASDLPQVFVVSYNYIIPKFTPYKAFRAVVGGWSLSGTLQYQNGALVATPAAQNNLSTALFRSTLFNRVPGVPLYTENPNSHIDPNAQFLYNPAAWSDPGPGQWGFGAPYYSDFRARRLPGENMSLGRIFHIWEKMNLEIRGEFFNAFNRIVVPGASPSNPLQTQVVSAAGVPQSGFGFMNASSGTQGRTGQVVARFVF